MQYKKVLIIWDDTIYALLKNGNSKLLNFKIFIIKYSWLSVNIYENKDLMISWSEYDFWIMLYEIATIWTKIR